MKENGIRLNPGLLFVQKIHLGNKMQHWEILKEIIHLYYD